MTFEKWYVDWQQENAIWIGPISALQDCWDASRTQTLFEANSKLGDEGNEAEKAQRLEVAISKLSARFNTKDEAEYLREVIAEAQG